MMNLNDSEESKDISQNDIDNKDNNEKKISWIKELRDWVVAILIAVLIATVIREYIFTLVKVDGASMEPILHHGDRLYVNRMHYTPKKGDVVIFKPTSDPNRPYVKRVIATEGDTVYIDFTKGEVYVNDTLIKEDYIKEETLQTGNYIISLIKDNNYSRTNPIVIQPGYIFVMGDNRNNSRDSRHLGPIPVEDVMGNAVFRFWPFDSFGSVHYDAEEISFMIDGDDVASLS